MQKQDKNNTNIKRKILSILNEIRTHDFLSPILLVLLVFVSGSVGLNLGQEQGYNKGLAEGYSSGFNYGYEVGFEEGEVWFNTTEILNYVDTYVNNSITVVEKTYDINVPDSEAQNLTFLFSEEDGIDFENWKLNNTGWEYFSQRHYVSDVNITENLTTTLHLYELLWSIPAESWDNLDLERGSVVSLANNSHQVNFVLDSLESILWVVWFQLALYTESLTNSSVSVIPYMIGCIIEPTGFYLLFFDFNVAKVE